MAIPSQTRIVTFKIDPLTLELLDKAAKELGLSRSELIRGALLKFLEALGYQVPYRIEYEGEPLSAETIEVELVNMPPSL